MTALAIATAAFLLTHLVSGTPLRGRLIAAIGEWPYRGVYSTVAFITLGAMIWAFRKAPTDEALWTGLRLVPLIVMPLAFILIACGYYRNPTAVGAEQLLKSDEPARGLIRVTRHPIMYAIMLWAAAHFLARGDLASLVFFGGFFLVALFGTLSMDRRKARDLGADWQRFAAVTSHVPFAAIAQGRNRVVWREIGWVRPLIGIFVFFVVFFLHPWLFGVAAAQGYAAKPVHMLVGFAPGGANDILARLVSQKLAESLAQPVLVENRPGNAGLIAAEQLAKSAPDGYSLMLGSTGTQTMAPHLQARLGFDAQRAFAPVSLVGSTPNALAVRPTLPVQTLQELIELAKRRQGLLSYASSGNGTTLHLAGVLFSRMAEVKLVHVAYKGNAPALNDVMGGQVDMIFSALPPLLPLAKAGKLKILGVASAERHRSAPELPTIAEQGLRDYESGTWYGVFAPAATPAPIVERLSDEIRKGLADPRIRDAMLGQGVDPQGSTPREFAQLFDAEYARWGKLIRDSGVKAD